MGVRENQSSQNSNKRQRPEESDVSSDSDTRQPIAHVTSQSALKVPRFLVVQSADSSRKVSDLSPFVIEKCIVSLAGQPKSIKKLKSGDLLLEVEKKKHIENLLRTKKLFDLDVNISLHKTLNCSKGVIRCEDLVPCNDVEILDHLRSQGVQDIRNIQVRRNLSLKYKHLRIYIQYTNYAKENKSSIHICERGGIRTKSSTMLPLPGVRPSRKQMYVQIVEKTNTAVIFATVIKQQSASTAVAHTPHFHATVRLGTKKGDP